MPSVDASKSAQGANSVYGTTMEGAGASSSMTMAELEAWLKKYMGSMWKSIEDQTKGVEDRQKQQTNLNNVKNTLLEGDYKSEPGQYSAELAEAAKAFPKGSPEYNEFMAASDAANTRAANVDRAELVTKCMGEAKTPEELKSLLMKKGMSEADATKIAAMAKDPFSKGLEPPAIVVAKMDGEWKYPEIDTKKLGGYIQGRVGELEKENQLAMIKVQQGMNQAQEGMSLVSNISKTKHDMDMTPIRNMAG